VKAASPCGERGQEEITTAGSRHVRTLEEGTDVPGTMI
jgi:hypothetical protein